MYKVFIGSLSYNTAEDALTQLLSEVEGFEKANIITDKMTNRSRGFAFASFSTKEGADEAIEKFNGYELDGFSLNVAHAKEKKRDDRGGSRGGFGGNRGGGRSGGFGGNRDRGGNRGGGFGGGNRW